MTNLEVSKLLRNVAVAYAITDEKKYRFQIIAYRNASEAIGSMTTQAKDLAREDRLGTIPGVGTSIQSHLKELFATGHVKQFEETLKDLPKAMFPLLDIPSFGPKKAYKLVLHFNLKDPETVVEAVETLGIEGKIRSLEGFGEKSEALILKAIEEFKKGKSKDVRMNLVFANELSEKLIAYMRKCKAVEDIYPLGSLRRKRDTVGDVDLAAATSDYEAVLDHFVAYPYIERLLQRGNNESSFLTAGGKRVDIRTMSKKNFGSLLQHFTGSKNHNVTLREYALRKGLSLSEYGIKDKNNPDAKIKEYDNEKDFYNALGLQWIPPEIREDNGELELAEKNMLPKLIELSDVKGDFHIHSSFPIEPSHDMGRNSMEEMLSHAKKLGYEYLAFSEHNPSISKHTKEEVLNILTRRKNVINDIQLKNKTVRIISLLETDILPNGHLAIKDDSLELLDGSIVSIHSVFNMPREDMTKRVISGLSHPKAKILAHPTGRLINERSGYDLDWDVIFDFCHKNNKAIEINASPSRLDLPDSLVKEALKYGVIFTIDTDSHATEQMNLMQYGVSVARRGWATKDDILNAWEYNKVINWFHNK